jgi:hypothetical protein
MLHGALSSYWTVVVLVVIDGLAWGAAYARSHDRGWRRGYADAHDTVILRRRDR